jgi:hypothetical protein
MHAARDGIAVRPADGAYHPIVSDLASVIEHVPASLRQTESAIDREGSSIGDDMSADLVRARRCPSRPAPR